MGIQINDTGTGFETGNICDPNAFYASTSLSLVEILSEQK